jgi:hypothetical protein
LQIALTLISEKHCEIEALKMFTVLTEFEPTLFQQAGCIDAASSMLTTFLAAKRYIVLLNYFCFQKKSKIYKSF